MTGTWQTSDDGMTDSDYPKDDGSPEVPDNGADAVDFGG